jgi:hypothetical protein
VGSRPASDRCRHHGLPVLTTARALPGSGSADRIAGTGPTDLVRGSRSTRTRGKEGISRNLQPTPRRIVWICAGIAPTGLGLSGRAASREKRAFGIRTRDFSASECPCPRTRPDRRTSPRHSSEDTNYWRPTKLPSGPTSRQTSNDSLIDEAAGHRYKPGFDRVKSGRISNRQ